MEKKARSIRLLNIANGDETLYDELHARSAVQNKVCTPLVCLSSALNNSGKGVNKVRRNDDLLQHAQDFLDQYFTSTKKANTPEHLSRIDQVKKEIEATGTYQLTETELIYGAKLAWRNSVRCIGRIQWTRLQVFDCRSVTTTSGMFYALCGHIKYASNNGKIRSAITIFPQRTDGKHDYRIWNTQLISYAGYKQQNGKIIGDPMHVEFTELCTKLGWRGKGTPFDILPLVLSANGHDPDYFNIPKEIILEVPLKHPSFDWFEQLGLKWYSPPAVSNMMFDCGGLQFTAAPFNGWYMSAEIGCRNLCDTYRLNMLETVALAMGLDTNTTTSLWKDKAMVECNIAVLYSFQLKGVTIVDHHAASESFMKHLENETRLRRGCPADWVWIVPPMSGSATPVFHQEMAVYHLKPNYTYQEPAWKTHIWKKGAAANNSTKPKRKFRFTQIARAAKFASKLFERALSRRIKATVLYATETGKSENYAKKLCELFSYAFNAQVYSMSDYDISNIEHESLLLVVTSTFGNGEPPEIGVQFARDLYNMKVRYISQIQENNSASSISVFKMIQCDNLKKLQSKNLFGPLSNMIFAVFALGSTAYPKFAAFGKSVDSLLGELGGVRLMEVVTGDELADQDNSFKKWAPDVFKLACDTFCLDQDESVHEATSQFKPETLSNATVRFVEAKEESIEASLTNYHNTQVSAGVLVNRTKLSGEKSTQATFLLEIETPLAYRTGDHVRVYPINNPDLVDKIIQRLTGVEDPDKVTQLQILKELQTSKGDVKSWVPYKKLPNCSLRQLLSRFLDITTPPSSFLLQYFASIATAKMDQEKLAVLTTDPASYESWKNWRFPHLLEVLEEFPSVRPYAPLLITRLHILQPRLYSISSSPSVHPNQIHATVADVVYRTEGGNGPVHYGVCSNYFQNLQISEQLHISVRSAPHFYLPEDISLPVILVGPGTGIAPFRAFWQQRWSESKIAGKAWLFFGCRYKELDLYRDDKAEMVELGVLHRVFLALSREPYTKKTYVQDLMVEVGDEIYRMLVLEKGHVYVCGDSVMAEGVNQTLKTIIQRHGGQIDADAYMLTLKDQNRYHEDVFGITLRTAEKLNKFGKSA
ncbi:nitric oxide synthase-like [Photinus pyralis]|uniref:Nitric oxide synthase n=1 Tax=Photinus pyralis TaxID=7054 RepID=A0A1Y1ML68_PHOPY|nr:nitric oxide synthase-like [Photinus pyralis]